MSASTAPTPHGAPNSARNALSASAPSTVSIGRRGRGAGIVVGAGHVVTNAHNLRDRTTQVSFHDGRTEQARLVGTDPDHDIVVLEVDTGDSPPISWADEPAQIGDTVYGLGRSRWGERVTAGMVSGVGRAFRGPRGRRVKGALEHTAPLARGSSGGPLVDADGRLLGINTHRLGDGFYLALPADDDLRQRIDTMAAGTSLMGRRLGITVLPGHVARRLRRRVGLPQRDGLLVSAVIEDSPADRAGVSDGDLIVKIDDTPVATVDDLWDALDAAGDDITLRLVRGTEERDVTITFATE